MTTSPDSIRPIWNAAAKAMSAGQINAAVPLLLRVTQIAPGFAPAWNNLGVALRRRRQWQAAECCLRRGLALPQGDIESAWSNLANVLRDQGRFEESDAAFLQARQRGDSTGTRYNHSLLLRDMNRLDEALALLQPLVAADPDNAQYQWDYALLLLQRGAWAEGFAAYEARWRLPHIPSLPSQQPQWNGEALAGRTLLVLSEQGLGDAIQFARYLPLISRDGGRVILQVRPPLLRLLAASPDLTGVTVVAQGDPLPDHDVMIPLLSLPRVLRAMPETIPPPLNLLVPQTMVDQAAAAFAPRQGRKRLALSWAGSPGHRNDANRSCGVEAMAPLLQNPDWDAYGLQIGPRAADLQTSGMVALCRDLSPGIDDYLDTAAFLRHIDLLISVDTGTVHLAASLGVPTLMVVPCAVDWRWGPSGTVTPWYPALQIARQLRQGDWATLMAHIAAEMARAMKE